MTSPERDIACSAVIVSGGLSSRMGGRNKTFLKLQGRTLLQHIVATLQPFFKEILLVTRQPQLYRDYPVRVVQDVYAARASLTGIHAGLVHAPTTFVFITACDAPFLNPALVEMLLDTVTGDTDVVVPQIDDHYEPLCAIYSKRCIPFIEAQLDRQDYKIFNFFNQIDLKLVPGPQIRQVDPHLHSFFNINTPEAYRRSQQMAAEIKP